MKPTLGYNDPDAFSPDELAVIKREVERGTFEIGPEDDRTWFENHPDRRYRLRRLLGGEIIISGGDVTRTDAVIVRCVRPGVRWKLMAHLTRARESYLDDEATARMLWREGWRLLPPENRRGLRALEREEKKKGKNSSRFHKHEGVS